MKLNGIKETVIYVSDLEVTKAFYEKILDIEAMAFEVNKHLFFKIGHSMLLFFNPEDSRGKKDIPSHYAYGEQHFALEVDKDEYFQWRTKISDIVSIEHEKKWKEHVFSFYFRDPERNSVEIAMKGIWGD